MNYRSETLGSLWSALSKAQGSYNPLKNNVIAAGGSYANLTAIIEATRKSLADNELAFNFYEEVTESGISMIWATLGHSSNEYMKSCSRITQQPTFRETFNAIENYKRLTACNMLGIAPSEHDPLLRDDAGEEEYDKKIIGDMRKSNNQETPKKSEFAVTISKEQYDDLMFELEGYPEIAKGLQEFFKIKTVADLPADQIYFARDKIRRLKKTHDEYVKTK